MLRPWLQEGELAGSTTVGLHLLRDLLFPARCVGCGLRGVDLCDGCLSCIRPLGPASCPRCGRSSGIGALCKRCRDYQGPLAGIRSAAIYEGVVRRAVHHFKYRHRQILALPLARLMATELHRRPLQVDLLVPVPLHPRRLSQRGYNQSTLLAQQLGELTELPVIECLDRHRETGIQADLSAAARRSNVRGAFRCHDGDELAERRVGIVDDVCTTGATLEDCARALREAGCASAWGIVVARDL